MKKESSRRRPPSKLSTAIGDHIFGLLKAIGTLYQFVATTIREFIGDDLMLRAMALTFGTILSLLPLLAILFSLFKMLGGGPWFNEMVRPALINFLAPGVEPVVSERLSHLINNFAAKTFGGVGLVLLIVGVHTIFTAVEMTFNLIWGGAPRGKFLMRVPLYYGLLVLIPLLIAGSLVVTTYLGTLKHILNSGFLDLLIRHGVPGAMVCLSLLLLYKFLPTAPVEWKSAITGAVVAAVMYEVVKYSFIFYASRLVNYDVLYGSLAIAPMLLVWINLAWIVALFGIELAYVHQHFAQLKHDPKHIRLSRMQQDALAFRILSETTTKWGTEGEWVNVGQLAENWNVPVGGTVEVVRRLVEGKVLERRGEEGDMVKLAASPEAVNIGMVDRALTVESGETWPWPAETQWSAVHGWLVSRERRGDAQAVTLAELGKELPRGALGSRRGLRLAELPDSQATQTKDHEKT